MNEKELDVVIEAFLDRDMFQEAFDTLSVGYDALHSVNVQLEAINTILTNDLEMSKAVSAGLEAEKISTEKALKKEVRKRRFNSVLLWSVSAATATVMVLYLVK